MFKKNSLNLLIRNKFVNFTTEKMQNKLLLWKLKKRYLTDIVGKKFTEKFTTTIYVYRIK